jgi:hypothetical protein
MAWLFHLFVGCFRQMVFMRRKGFYSRFDIALYSRETRMSKGGKLQGQINGRR